MTTIGRSYEACSSHTSIKYRFCLRFSSGAISLDRGGLPRTLLHYCNCRSTCAVSSKWTRGLTSSYYLASTLSHGAHLTTLKIVVDGLNFFPRLLRLCPNLSSLPMIGIFTLIETSEAFAHANLQSWRISGDLHLDSIGNLGLFNGITHPNLRAVDVRNIGQWPYEEFKAFLTRSQCPPKSLIFDGGAMTTD